MVDRPHPDAHTAGQRRGVFTMITAGILLHLVGLAGLAMTGSIISLLVAFIAVPLIFLGMIYYSGPDDEQNVTHHEMGYGPGRHESRRAAWAGRSQ